MGVFSYATFYLIPPTVQINGVDSIGEIDRPILLLQPGDIVTTSISMTFPGSTSDCGLWVTPGALVTDGGSVKGVGGVNTETWFSTSQGGVGEQSWAPSPQEPVTFAVSPSLTADAYPQSFDISLLQPDTTLTFEGVPAESAYSIDGGVNFIDTFGTYYVARVDLTVDNPDRTSAPPPPKHFLEEDKKKFEKDSQSLDTISHGLDIATSKSQQDLILQDAKWGASALTDTLAPEIGDGNAVGQAILTITETINSVKDANPVGLVLNASSAFASLGSLVMKWLAADPPDGNFTQVYTPQSTTFNVAGASTADNALLTDMYNLVQDSVVMLTSAERYEGAELAGDASSQSLQDAAFNAGQNNYSADTQKVSTDLTAVLNELIAQGVPDATLDGSDLVAVQAYLQSAGSSDPFLIQLTSDLSNLIGSSTAQANVQAILASIEAEQPPPTGGSLYESLRAAASELANSSSSTPTVADFNGDGTSDVLLQAGGTVVDWIMNNGQYQAGNVLTNGAAGWQVVGTGDFTGSGTAGVLLQNDGTVVDWVMSNGQYQAGNVLTNGAAGWQVVGTGDFNGDGTSDVVLQNGGTVVDWTMSNGAYQSGSVLTNGAAGWQVVGTGDFTGNGTSDVVLQNGGSVVDWIMQNGAYSSGNVLTNGATGWSVVGTGDFTGTGTADVLLQNGGTVVDWIMQNGQYQSGNVLTTAAAGWNVVGTGDYNGDGTSDVLLQNGGTVVDWIMKNGAFQSGNVITNAAAGFQVAKT